MASEDASHGDAFHNLLYLVVFLAAAWAAGKVASILRMPALVGEILLGACMGPPLADVVPFSAAVSLLGEVGLVLLVVEAGLEVQLPVLKQVGGRSVAVAFVGSLCGPLLLGLGFAVALGASVKEGLAVGVALSPTSMGAALVVLKRARALNTPTGQLIVAAAVVDDVIALVLLSELRALASPSPAAFAVPIASAIGFIGGVGAAAVYLVPPLLTRVVLPLLPPAMVEEGVMLLLMGTTFGLMAACNAAQCSFLLGAFLAGLCFCSLHSLHRVWTSQVKRAQTWLVRIFFAATVGFAIPLRSFGTGNVWAGGMLFFCAVAGKLATGLLAKPLTLPDALTIGTAMGAWGEIAFVVALTAKNELSLMSNDVYASVMLAVLLSVVAGPTSLRAVLAWEARRTAAALAAANAATKRGVVYYKLSLRTTNRFGLMPELLRLLAREGVEVLDCRVDSQSGGRLALFEAYLKDTQLADADPATRTAAGLGVRMVHLRTRLLEEVLAHDEQARIVSDADAEEQSEQTVDWSSLRGLVLTRWMPGAAPDEWAAAGLEGAEETATGIMRRELETRALRNVRFAVGPAEEPEEDARALAAEAAAIHAAADVEDATSAAAEQQSSPQEQLGDDAATVADRALSAAASAAEEERALRAHEGEARGLVGAVRQVPPRGLDAETPETATRLARAFSVRLAAAPQLTSELAAMQRGRSELQRRNSNRRNSAGAGAGSDFDDAVAAFRASLKGDGPAG